MQAAQDAPGAGQRMVVLHEGLTYARSGQRRAIVGLGEEAALIAKDRRGDELHLRDRQRLDFDWHVSPAISAPLLAEPRRRANAPKRLGYRGNRIIGAEPDRQLPLYVE